MADETDGRGDVIPRSLNELDDVDGVPVEGSTLRYTDGAWQPISGDVRAEPPILNFYKLTKSPVAHDTTITISAEPVVDTDWDSYSSPEFGEWFQQSSEWKWRPLAAGTFQIVSKLEIILNTTAHLTTRMNVTTLNGPIDNIAGGHDYERFVGFGAPQTLETWMYDSMFANEEGIEAGDVWWGANGYWRRGASETATNTEWTIRVAKYEPGHSDVWGTF